MAPQWSEPVSPNNAIVPSGTKLSSISPPLCLHCRKEIETPYKNNYCCSGCYFVYHFITSHDLGKYYEILKRVGESDTSKKDWQEDELHKFENDNFSQMFLLKEGEYALFLPDMKCAACLWLIETLLKKYNEIHSYNINLLQKTLTLNQKKEFLIPINKISKELYLCGYKPLPLPFSSSLEFRTQYEKDSLKNIAVSGFSMGNIMLLNLAIYFGHFFGIEENVKTAFYFISMVIAIPAVIYSGRPFFKNAFYSLKLKTIHIDTTISFALLVILISSIYATFAHHSYIYFDTLTGLIFLLLLSRYLHEKYLAKAREMSEFVDTMVPKESFLIKPGDKIEIPVGKTIPVDGTICAGSSEVNEASLTGEQRAVFKQITDCVLAGSQNLTQPLTIIAEKTGHNTWIAQLTKLIAQARLQKSQIETQLEKIMPFFTYTILILSAFSLIFWYFVNPSNMLPVSTAILVVTCPCALALATPLTFSNALKTFWKHSILVKNSAAIETLTKVNAVILDKTGTLTSENINISNVHCMHSISDAEKKFSLGLLGFAAKRSLHPISRAISLAYFNSNISAQIQTIHEYPGLGLEAIILNSENREIFIRLGQKDFVGINFHNEGNFVYAKVANNYFAFQLEETINEGAQNFIHYLNKKNIEIFLLSGDNTSNVETVARKLNIPLLNVFGQLKPQQKLAFLENLQKRTKIVLAIGDGVNDAAMLAKAHVSIATHGGVDVSIQASDIFLLKKNFNQLIQLFKASFYTVQTLKIVLTFSLIYNALAVALAFGNFVTPLFTAILMPISSLCVFLITNFRIGNKIWKL